MFISLISIYIYKLNIYPTYTYSTYIYTYTIHTTYILLLTLYPTLYTHTLPFLQSTLSAPLCDPPLLLVGLIPVLTSKRCSQRI